ncbi:MAG: 1-(5-phosphoribosyl)-5-[(5-phosphoribosylamino)methylideneamino]imidazole-4-carboxamide isomerase [Deltaproteobacteria bacterium]|nr:1-(5-phosphoribosyl)-5-[(5-phosphoribosylamino)methylideneamino]imidazole-4-carboxamide isomerase [Deltaproteobacteria bacterium]MBW2068498.1 1-(5-phosphoribosyl)-5-[(5-phosphoribosylamino)methylideneamino]imidazole-4-carboxamide isomerase [Deltaproteobacteria bacterium]
MIIYPAIDLRHGRCVRLYQGDPDKETVYFEDPVEVALLWESQGARWLHLVDLDGAFSGRPEQIELIERIVSAVGIPVQVGGGIRTLEDVERYISIGVRRVIIGTVALKEPERFARICEAFPGFVAVGVDAKDGIVAVKGWKEQSGHKIEYCLDFWKNLPLAAIIYTDISRDGTRRGVNVEETERLLRISSVPVIASGGVASLDDIQRLLPLAKKGLNGVIVGRALYTGDLKLTDALALVKSKKEGKSGAEGTD